MMRNAIFVDRERQTEIAADSHSIMKSISIKSIRVTALLWAALPTVMMVMFWFRWIVSIPVVILMAVGLYKAINKLLTDPCRSIEMSCGVVAVLLLVAVWMVFIGIGGFFGQESWDNSFRNAVLEDLTLRNWPVTYCEYRPFAYLSYYFAFWLPAAAVGKLFASYDVAQIALFIYSYIGLASLALLVMEYCRKRKFLVGMLLFAFCGLDIVNNVLFDFLLDWHDNLYVGTALFGAPTMMYLCTYIYNQGISAWVVLFLMHDMRKDTGVQLLLFSFLFALAPFPAMVVAPILAIVFIKKMRTLLTFPNVAGFLTCILIAIFYMGNSSGTSLQTIFESNEYTYVQVAILALCCIVFNYGVFLPFIWKEVKRDALFWGLLASAMAISLIMPAYGNYDFGWKAPMAFTGYFMLKILKYCAEMKWSWRRLSSVVFGCLLAVGALSNYNIYIMDVWRTYRLVTGAEKTRRSDKFSNKLFDPAVNICYDNFVTDQETLYSRYLMPRNNPAPERE